MRALVLGLVGVCVVSAFAFGCGSSSGGSSSSSSGASSSSGGSSSSSSSSGGGGGETCSPQADPHFFDGATVVAGAGSLTPPCPPGTKPVQLSPGGSSGGSPGPAQVYASAAELAAASCMPDDAGAPDGGAQVDFAVSDVVAVPALDFTPLALQLLDVKGELWVRRNDTWCGGAAPTRYETFFVVKKGTVVHVNACTSGCSGDPVP